MKIKKKIIKKKIIKKKKKKKKKKLFTFFFLFTYIYNSSIYFLHFSFTDLIALMLVIFLTI